MYLYSGGDSLQWRDILLIPTQCAGKCITYTHSLAICRHTTVKPFNLAARKVGDLACEIILAPLFWRIKTIQFEIL